MDTSTIAQLIEAFQTMGGDAKEGFIWYIVVSHLSGVLWAIGGIALICMLIRTVRYAVLQHLTERKIITRIRAAGQISPYGGFDASDQWDYVVNCIAKHHLDKDYRSRP